MLKSLYPRVRAGHEMFSRHVALLAFYDLRKGVIDMWNEKTGTTLSQADARPGTTGSTASGDVAFDLNNVRVLTTTLVSAAFLVVNVSLVPGGLCLLQLRRKAKAGAHESPYNFHENVRGKPLWDHACSGYVTQGLLFTDTNDDSSFNEGVVYWERNLYRFFRQIMPFTPHELQKVRDTMGDDFVIPPYRPGLAGGASSAILEGWNGILQAFQLLIPFKQVRKDMSWLPVTAQDCWLDREH